MSDLPNLRRRQAEEVAPVAKAEAVTVGQKVAAAPAPVVPAMGGLAQGSGEATGRAQVKRYSHPEGGPSAALFSSNHKIDPEGREAIQGIGRAFWVSGWSSAIEDKGLSSRFAGQNLFDHAPQTQPFMLQRGREAAADLCIMNDSTCGLEDLMAPARKLEAMWLDSQAAVVAAQAEAGDAIVPVNYPATMGALRVDFALARQEAVDALLKDEVRLTQAMRVLLNEGARAYGRDPEECAEDFGHKVGAQILGDGSRWTDDLKDRDAFEAKVRIPLHDAVGLDRVEPEDLTRTGDYRPRAMASASCRGQYVKLEVQENGSLNLVAEPELAEELDRLRGKSDSEVWGELLADHLGNGWDWITPKDLGALTEANIIATGVMRDHAGDLRAYPGAVAFAHMNYQVENVLDTLAEGRAVQMVRCDLDPFTTRWHAASELPRDVQSPYGGDVLYALQGGELLANYESGPMEFIGQRACLLETETKRQMAQAIEDWLYECGDGARLDLKEADARLWAAADLACHEVAGVMGARDFYGASDADQDRFRAMVVLFSDSYPAILRKQDAEVESGFEKLAYSAPAKNRDQEARRKVFVKEFLSAARTFAAGEPGVVERLHFASRLATATRADEEQAAYQNRNELRS